MRSRLAAALVAATALALPARRAAAQSVGEDLKDAGKSVGHAGATVGKGTAKLAKKGAKGVAKGAKATGHAVAKGADATADAAKDAGQYAKKRVTPSQKAKRAAQHDSASM